MIDAALARRLVDAQFPRWSHLPLAPVDHDGWDNRTFRLGAELAVRLPSGPAYAAQVAKEQRWLPLLARQLPLPIPVPVAQGEPGCGFPHAWSVYRWIDGEVAAHAPVGDRAAFARALAGFLRALRAAPAEEGPAPGPHNFFRGGPLETYAEETAQALPALDGVLPRAAAERVWDHALASRWTAAPVWVHGDVAATNLLARDGRLAAVIDFGSSGVGDPACDLVIAWTFFGGPVRAAFRGAVGLDAGTWSRGRGWALWKALITLRDRLETDAPGAAEQRRVIAAVLADHARYG